MSKESSKTARIRRGGRILLAVLAGYLALILLTTVAQEVMFSGIDYYDSPRDDLIFGGLATFIAAVFSGMVAAILVDGRSVIPHLVISILILTETTYLILSGTLRGPLWFDILSGLALIIGVWAGHFAIRRFRYGG